ncbi:hypothetical protein F5876DRAFT_65877 [Lentinula aff. lateritia]|uniref:Uncharacterized protein n=1 Tax=Lentinula aff. lateritia TaxID=2804960 RepID=A0ACC1TZE2_9AGAR|nr:hypothetical protein F5876DRAFT_65877 [Lentinula aff. lateritia]
MLRRPVSAILLLAQLVAIEIQNLTHYAQLATVPNHVRRYINPGVRRVFLDSTYSERLRWQLSTTEVQIKRRKKEFDKPRASNESKKRKSDQAQNDWREKNDQLLDKYTCKKRKLVDTMSALQEMKKRLDASHAANVQKTAVLAQLAKKKCMAETVLDAQGRSGRAK